MPINLNHLSIFHAVAEERSVSRAAERLMVSQPAVSKQLKLLERALGAPLFDRTPKGVVPTAAGELLKGYARRLFALSAEAEQALAELRGLDRGCIAVGASTTLGVYLLPDVFVKFRRRHPGVAVRMEIAAGDALHERLCGGSIDVALTERPAEDPTLEQEVLMQEELVAIAPPGHPLARRRKVSVATLCREQFVVRETGSGTKSLVERALADRGLAVRSAMSLGGTEAIKRAVAAGVGVAFVSRMAAAAELAAGLLAEVRLSDLSLRRPVYRTRLLGRHQSRAEAAFTELLLESVR